MARSKRTYNNDFKYWGGHGDESLKLIDWYGRRYCRRFKAKEDCACGGHSAGNKKLSHHGHYMRYSYRQLRRAKMMEMGPIPVRK